MAQYTTISQDIIDKVSEIDIVDVVSQYVTLKKRGANYIGLCPFHTDSTPSFYVSPAKQICKCFACGKPDKGEGGVIHFVEQMEGISFPAAVRLLGKTYNIDIPEIQLTSEEEAKEKRRESMYIALQAAQQQFIENYAASPDARHYIADTREVSDEFRELYGIGFATTGSQLTKLLPSKGFKTDTLIATGILGQNEERGTVYDRFQNRAMFPFHDLHGRVVGFTGRDMSGQSGTAKYSNSPSTELFNKSEIVYGLYQAKQRIAETNEVYIVEGQMDTISFAGNGLRNTVAGSGTAFTDAQVKSLHRFATTAILIYDGDAAGIKASIRQIQTLLSHGMTVKCFALPSGMDPDDFARKLGKDKLPKAIQQGTMHFDDYLCDVLDIPSKTKEALLADLKTICECISSIPDELLRKEYIRGVASKFGYSAKEVSELIKPQKSTIIEEWKPGFYGVADAAKLIKKDKNAVCTLTFDRKYFIDNVGEEPIVYSHGYPSIPDIQVLRSKIGKLYLTDEEKNITPDYTESDELLVLKTLFKEGFEIEIDASIYDSKVDYDDDEDGSVFVSKDSTYTFCDFYIVGCGYLIANETNGVLRSNIIERCAEIIAELKAAARVVMVKTYAKRLDIDKTALEKVLKPILSTKKDRAVFENQRLSEMSDIASIDPSVLPDYVVEDEALSKKHSLYNFYPLKNKTGEDVAYMYKNSQGNGYTRITDFVIEPLLHVYDKISQANKRVVYLRHMHSEYNRYVEWQSSILANVAKVNEKLIEEGPYNFSGTPAEYRKIWAAISYDFTYCRELRILGQHNGEVFAFGNAIFHKVKDPETGVEKYQVDYADKIGIVSHNGENFYLPAFSEIRLSDFDKDDSYKQALHLKYKEIPESDRLTFDQWAQLMDEVYKINDNGKWSILYAITAAFRDFIFKERRFFTALFFIGPTSSGKSQVASSIRNLFMDVDMPLFNLNTGSFASLTMLMEQLRNIVLVLEEYNDKQIPDQVFQLLKAAVLDGVGRTKVADTATKTTTSSEINTPLILLGQEAPQKDDGSLSNRSILRDVPYTEKGEFTEDETEKFNRLKRHERIGLCNILTDILALRDVFEKEYLRIFDAEVKLLKDDVKLSVTNTDGLTRIINAVALLTSTCRLIENHTSLELPFTYADFFKLATNQVVSQLEQIATTNKLASFFNSVDTLLTRGKVIKGRDFRISFETSVRRVVKGKDSEDLDLATGLNVLYLDMNSLYSDYESFVGKDAAAPLQTLIMNFKSNPAYLGYNRGTRFSWQDTGYIEKGNITTAGTIDTNARLKITKESRVKSAHMFNYDMLKTLMDIDLDRESDEDPHTAEPPMPQAKTEPTPAAPDPEPKIDFNASDEAEPDDVPF